MIENFLGPKYKFWKLKIFLWSRLALGPQRGRCGRDHLNKDDVILPCEPQMKDNRMWGVAEFLCPGDRGLGSSHC